ncbi:MAG: lysophospholipid acyltransferase family protein [Anaeroplasma sp.]
MKEEIKKPKWYLRILLHIVSRALIFGKKVKVERINCEQLKWPYLLIASHASFLDFAMNAKVTFPHNTNYITSIEEFVGREWLMKGIGCFPKRKFTKDGTIVENVLTCLNDRRNTVTIYPEARYSIIGCNERIDKSMGKLAKISKVPVVVLLTHGNFLHQPQWDKKHKRIKKFEVSLKCIVNEEEIKTLSALEIQRRIENEFKYDDYQWQYDNKIITKSKHRANNLHRVLYKCPHCGCDYTMTSKLDKLWCTSCGVSYNVNQYERLECENSEAKFVHIPDWYNWERSEVRKEIENEEYQFIDTVRIERLDNLKKGFKSLGHITFKHDLEGIHLYGTLDDNEEFKFDNAPINTPSIHIEYDFKKKGTINKGQAIDINDIENTWFIYPQTDKCVLTKLHLAVEELYDIAASKQKGRRLI